MKIILTDEEVIEAIRDYLAERVGDAGDFKVERYYSETEGGGDFKAIVTVIDAPENP